MSEILYSPTEQSVSDEKRAAILVLVGNCETVIADDTQGVTRKVPGQTKQPQTFHDMQRGADDRARDWDLACKKAHYYCERQLRLREIVAHANFDLRHDLWLPDRSGAIRPRGTCQTQARQNDNITRSSPQRDRK